MRAFEDYNPIVIAIYFLCVAGLAMFCMNPIILLLSLIGALCLYIARNGRRNARSHFAYLALFAAMALVNPLVSHNGATVLFVINDSPITAEATLYGVVASAMIIAVLYWFRSFSQIMSSDKLLYLFGALSPKLALVLSMGLRYVPLFAAQRRRVNNAQKALGLYNEDNVIDRTKGGLRVFSVMVSWALEGGIITADSMAARGYGTGKRSRFSIFRFRATDGVLLMLTLALFCVCCVSAAMGAIDFSFYPTVRFARASVLTVAGYISYGILVMIPTIIQMEEGIRWKYLRSRI